MSDLIIFKGLEGETKIYSPDFNNGWTKVEDDLPTEFGKYLTYPGYQIINFDNAKRWLVSGCFNNWDEEKRRHIILNHITHWMPVTLPQPPKN